MVDYNLYGMGHAHVSNLKFRSPLPDSYLQNKGRNGCIENGPEVRGMSHDFANPAGSNSSLASPIWLTSTVPNDLKWRFCAEDFLFDQDVQIITRQTTCELEGDAKVDDILNQQFITRSSLSQTHSDVKMVQSLVPIWEEEYERNGVNDAGMTCNILKPPPEDVLATLSHGREFKAETGYLTGDSDVPFIKKLTTLRSIKSCIKPESSSLYIDADTRFIEAEILQRSCLTAGLPCMQLDISDNEYIKPIREKLQQKNHNIHPVETSGTQVMDEDAVGLLRWLASSQAAEDINSDDELARESILSPLLSPENIDKVLEKTNKEFESEFQQECQDILDSVDYSVAFEVLKEKGVSDTSSKICSEKMVHLDGSDEPVYMSASNSSAMATDTKRESAHKSLLAVEVDRVANKEQNSSEVYRDQEYFSSKIVNDGELGSVEVSGGSKRKAYTTGATSFEKEAEECSNVFFTARTNCHGPPGSLASCSLHEIMGKKQHYLRDISNCGMEKKNVGGWEIGLCSSIVTQARFSHTEPSKGELIGMTLFGKPPSICWVGDKNKTSIGLRSSASMIFHLLQPGLDYSLPFFCGNQAENIHSWQKDADTEIQGIMGVPAYVKIGGAVLYLLTPLSGSPTRSCVQKWLVHENLENIDAGVHNIFSIDPHRTNMLNGVDNGKIEDIPSVSKIQEVSEKCTPRFQDTSQISAPPQKSELTPVSQTGFRDSATCGAGQQLTLLSLEILAECRGELRPDPQFDAVNLIALILQDDNDTVSDIYVLLRANPECSARNIDAISHCKMCFSTDEKHLFKHFIDIVTSVDPDIIMGWDTQSASIGYLAERASYLGVALLSGIGRALSDKYVGDRGSSIGLHNDNLSESLLPDLVPSQDSIIENEWGRTHASGIHICGRMVLNIWRLIRSEVKLNMYTIESVADAVLRRKVPSMHYRTLANWYASNSGKARFRCIEYVTVRAKLNFEIMDQLDMINRTSELARIFGIEFFAVLSRGSQYRVESMLLRLAHTQNYIAISPGYQQVASQPAMECLPLVMEPESGFYKDPVIVLDFQSLYPSMIIAYNLCFSTCLGKVLLSKDNTLGVSCYSRDTDFLQSIKQQLLITPNGVMYVPSKVRRGIMPRLLEEILSTRIMVKQIMKKLAPSQKVLNRIFNARQLALKLIANVTYGYTAAGFSGRMPCSELADSIVECGRRTLETAISFVNSYEKWKARVIYGDTDSMFVLLEGRSIEDAFCIGQEIADAVTYMNPTPVTLKMEKVYRPCVLLTKKRYVGYSYESADQTEPVFDAKGIEMVRRDSCGAVAKTMEQSLRLLFEYHDLLKVKSYLQRQWAKILSGRISLQDFVFAKEVRLGTYSVNSSSLPPAAIVALKSMRTDPRAEPRYAERVPYVVIHGSPGSRLVDLVIDPLDLLAIDSPFRLNDLYYIKKQIIPALQRVFGLLGDDLNQWFSELPRPAGKSFMKRNFCDQNVIRTRIDYYYSSRHCMLCGELAVKTEHLCDRCSLRTTALAAAMTGRTSKLEREMQHLVAICRHCGGGDWITESGVKCTSLACPVFFERRKVQKELRSSSAVAAQGGFYPKCNVEWF